LGEVFKAEINGDVGAKSFDIGPRRSGSDFGMEKLGEVDEFATLFEGQVTPVFEEKFFFAHGVGGSDSHFRPIIARDFCRSVKRSGFPIYAA
jgi:hypothetical protein